jgi:hypothetical protein
MKISAHCTPHVPQTSYAWSKPGSDASVKEALDELYTELDRISRLADLSGMNTACFSPAGTQDLKTVFGMIAGKICEADALLSELLDSALRTGKCPHHEPPAEPGPSTTENPDSLIF